MNCSSNISPYNINLIKSPLQIMAGATALLISWLNLLLFIRQFPRFGIYVMMFTQVVATFLEVFPVFALFIIAFASCFSILMSNKIPFLSIRNAIYSTTVMMIGEFDFQGTILGYQSEIECDADICEPLAVNDVV